MLPGLFCEWLCFRPAAVATLLPCAAAQVSNHDATLGNGFIPIERTGLPTTRWRFATRELTRTNGWRVNIRPSRSIKVKVAGSHWRLA